jgi:hypothetical protein
MLPKTVHIRILLFWCPYFEEKLKAHHHRARRALN